MTVKKNGITKILAHYSYIFVFIVIFIVFVLVSNGMTWSGIMNIPRHSAVIGVMSIGMGLVCLIGEIDLSVGSMLAFISGFAVVVFNVTDNIVLVLLFCLLFGAFLGLINGFLVGYMKMPAFIVTLATMLIYRSLAQYFCQNIPKDLIGGGSSVYRMDSALSSYQTLYSFGNGRVATVPIVGIVLFVMMVVFIYLTTSTKFGKKIYAIGSNSKGAVMAGINVDLMVVLVFVITGALVGLSAYLWIAMNASADPATTGNSYEMYAIASVVLGGISMSGGRGRCLGILFGAMSYTVIDKIIVALKMDSLINDAIKGVILILVILIQMAGPRIKEQLARRK